MSHTIFTENMKLADMVLANYRMFYILPRFGIDLGFGEATAKGVCEEKGISAILFLAVCNIYAFDDYLPSVEVLEKIPTEELIDYLKRSHVDYRDNRMPALMDQIEDAIIANCSPVHARTLREFCSKYRDEVYAHFGYEDEVVFPYIGSLLEGKSSKYSINEYESNHSSIDAALNDLKSIMIKYMPGECSLSRSRDALISIFLVEDDLNKHSLIEDKVLVPIIERIEKGRIDG